MTGIFQPPPRRELKVYNEIGTDIHSDFRAILDRYYLSKAIVYRDQFVDGLSLKGGAADPPTFAAFSGGVWANRFDNGATMASHATIELQHDYVDGSDMELHIHWSPSTTNTGNVRWGCEYTFANMDATFPATTTVTAVSAGGGIVNRHQYLTLATISGIGLTKGAVMAFRIYREGAHAADTFTGNAFLHRIALHYAVDKLGST